MSTLNNNDDSTSTPQGQSGQTFFEFILLLLVVIMISGVFYSGFRRGASGYWRAAMMLLCVHGHTESSAKNACVDIISN